MNVGLLVLLFLSSLVAVVVGILAVAFYAMIEAPSLEAFVKSHCTILRHSTVYVDYQTRRTHQIGYRAVWLVRYRCRTERSQGEVRVANLTAQTLQGSAEEFDTPALAKAKAMDRPVGSSVDCWCLPERLPSPVSEEGRTNNAVVWEEPRILMPTSVSGPAMALLPLGLLGLLLACCAHRLKCCRSAPRSRFERDHFGSI